MRVLIVDDGPAGKDLSDYLKKAYGAETFLAKSIEEGFKLRRDIEGLDFIVYDLSFPNSTREQSIDCIPMMSDGIPLFVYTGYEEKEIIQRSLTAGAMDCFLKGDNHKGGSALAARLGSIYIRQHVKGTMPEPKREKIANAVFETRKAQANTDPRQRWDWLRSAWTVAGVAMSQLILIGGVIWNMALFSRQVAENTADVRDLKLGATAEHEKGRTSEMDRAQLNARVTAMDNRMNGFDTKLDVMRSENTQGFQKIYDVMLQDAKSHSPAGNRN